MECVDQVSRPLSLHTPREGIFGRLWLAIGLTVLGLLLGGVTLYLSANSYEVL